MFVALIASATLALAVPLVRRGSLAAWLFAGGLALLCLETAFNARTLQAVGSVEVMEWQNRRLWATGLVPGIWLMFSLCYSRGNFRTFLAQWWPLLAASVALPILLLAFFPDRLLAQRLEGAQSGHWIAVLTLPGKALQLVVLLGSILVLVNLEKTFRTAVGTMRWRVKFVAIGLAVLFGARLYAASQALLYSAISAPQLVIEASALLIACLLIAISILRTGLFEIDVYPSSVVLTNSLTFLLAGIYLLIVGLLAKLVAALGGDAAFPLKAGLVLVGLTGLAVLLLSDRLRLRIRHFASRHFQRPVHDYRRLWTQFSGRTASIIDQKELSQTTVRLVSETLEVLSVSVWLVDEQTRSLTLAASTTLSRDQLVAPAGQGAEADRSVLEELRKHPEPFDVDTTKESWVESLKQYQPDCFGKGGGRLFAPLLAGGELLGVLTVGDRISGVPFGIEDVDLLRCIGAQLSASLLNLRLSRHLIEAREMEAFQTMSAFFVHDLKNAASTLSLMLQNLPVHFDKPAFRDDALRAIGKTTSRINDLIVRLALLRQELKLAPVPADLNVVIREALDSLAGIELPLSLSLGAVPPAPLDSAQFQKVVTNLVLNARDALAAGGQIEVTTGAENGWVVMSVRDNGCGMTGEFISRYLFRPFQTSKKRGLGLGMFHTKVIVEAHRGRVEVESSPGKGTTFRVLLPAADLN